MNEYRPARKKRPRIYGKKAVVAVYKPTENKIDIEEEILQKIGALADELKVKVYVVGGYVRDYFLNRPRADFDCTVVGDSIQFAKTLAKRVKSKAVVYETFRTAMVPLGEFKCEFVGTRKEEYLPNTRKPVVKEGEFEDDLCRRDFTINAMAASLNSEDFGEVVDIFKGKDDIEKRLLRTPLNPSATFSDDPLRMMRAARFAAQLDFEVDESVLSAAKKMANRISIVSKERIADEFIKIMASNNPAKGINLLYEMNMLESIFPEIHNLAGVEIVQEGSVEYGHKDVLRHTLKVLAKTAEKSENIWLRFAALMHDIAKPKTKRFSKEKGWTFHGHEELGARWTKGIFRRMKLPLANVEYVEKLIRLHQRPMALVDDGVSDSAVRRLAFQAGDALEDLFILCRADITTKNPKLTEKYLNNYEIVAQKVIDVQEKDKLREFQSPVRGEEIMETCGLQPCKAVGIIKTNIEEAILDGDIPNEYEAAKEFFLENKDKWLSKMEARDILLQEK